MPKQRRREIWRDCRPRGWGVFALCWSVYFVVCWLAILIWPARYFIVSIVLLPPTVMAEFHFEVVAALPCIRRALGGLCPTCGYILRGNGSGICPECGTAINERRGGASVETHEAGKEGHCGQS